MNGHRDIVEHAEAGSFSAKSMMRAAGQVASPARIEGIACSAQRSSDRSQGALHQGLRPRKSDAANGSVAKSAIQKIADIRSIMGQFDDARLSQRSRFEAEAAIAGQQIAQHSVFSHGKLMAGRKRDSVMVAIEEAMLHEIIAWTGLGSGHP